MNYNLFIETLLQELVNALAPDVCPSIEHRAESGDPLGDFVVFTPRDTSKTVAYPVVSAKNCYDLYKSTNDMSRVVSRILYSIENASAIMGISPDDFARYEKVKDNICLKLMNYEHNKAILKDIPHIRYYDLALACIYLTHKSDDSGLQSIQVRNNYLNMWHITKNDLLKQAIENTPKLMQPQIIPMEDVLRDIPSFSAKSGRRNMYILTNQDRFLGAVCMTFPNVLMDFAQKKNADLIILPSSTHEIILVPDDGNVFEDLDRFNRIISSVNNDMVEPMDQLSDHFYRFDRTSMKLQY